MCLQNVSKLVSHSVLKNELVWIHVGTKLYKLKRTNVCLVIIKWYQKRKEKKKLSPSLHEEGVPPQLGLLVNLKSEREKKKTHSEAPPMLTVLYFFLQMGQNVLRLLSVPGWGHFPQLNWSEMKKKKKEPSKNKLCLVQWVHLRSNPENYTHSYHIHNTLGPCPH